MVLSYSKKGQVSAFVLLMIGMVFFLMGLALTPAIHDVIEEATSTVQLNCSNTSISDQDKANCDAIDIQQFLFIGTIFGLAGILITRVII